jgi:hypothetical protein
MIAGAKPGVKSKGSTRFVENTARLPAWERLGDKLDSWSPGVI